MKPEKSKEIPPEELNGYISEFIVAFKEALRLNGTF